MMEAFSWFYLHYAFLDWALQIWLLLLLIIQAEVKRFCHEPCSLEIFLHHLKDIDFHSLLGICLELDGSEIEAVDVCNGSSCMLNGEYALVLMRAINKKLRVVDLKKLSFGKDFLRYIWFLIVILYVDNLIYLVVLSFDSAFFMFSWSSLDC